MLTIDIRDLGTSSTYTLAGGTLTMTNSGGCDDALNRNGCEVRDDMTDNEIEEVVYESWSEGYHGDPTENGLTVTVTR